VRRILLDEVAAGDRDLGLVREATRENSSDLPTIKIPGSAAMSSFGAAASLSQVPYPVTIFTTSGGSGR
jgi:hypothetical protein